MENRILGLHHITAIAGNAKRNFDFYTRVMGLRMVKKTVNFDDPGTYHFYFGDEIGSPGTILTFFPWEGIGKGKSGNGMMTETGYSVPSGSLDFWKQRLTNAGVQSLQTGTRFGENFLSFQDPDGLPLSLIVPSAADSRKPWETKDVNASVATRGFHSITLSVNDRKGTAKVLTDIFGYTEASNEGNRYRYLTDAIAETGIVDIVEDTRGNSGVNSGGTFHHVAFRVPDEKTLMHFREKVVSHGLRITEKIDRNYFFSLYFREPGGVLFEIATDNPGFAVDEPVSELGKNLKLPAQYEAHRSKIVEVLPVLD